MFYAFNDDIIGKISLNRLSSGISINNIFNFLFFYFNDSNKIKSQIKNSSIKKEISIR